MLSISFGWQKNLGRICLAWNRANYSYGLHFWLNPKYKVTNGYVQSFYDGYDLCFFQIGRIFCLSWMEFWDDTTLSMT